MAEVESLLLNAKRLTAKARVKRDNAAGVQADGQFSTALNKLTSQFSDLQTQLANRTVLVTEGVPIGPAPDLTKSAERLRSQIADIGRPTPQFLNSRSADLAASIKALQALSDGAWKGWAEAQIGSLHIDPDLLHGIRGQEVTDKLSELSQEARKPYGATNIRLFKLWLDQIRDLIARLETPTTPEEVVARIEAERGTLTFADLTNEEIDALRHSPEDGRRVRLSVR